MNEKKIGRYTLKSELGRGGMATVYLAYDPVLERDVALKLLPTYFAHDPEFSARFEREAKTVAALEHGSIVSMYDYGEDGEWPYFVMRLMKGGSLKERIADGPMSLDDATQIIHRVAGALGKAHSKDIVHRDVKPANIMFDEDGMAYLGDFGIVKLAESSENHTRLNSTLGTPEYMSPEQADGEPDIDGRSDIYALGIVLYEMLAGTAPYTHDSMTRLMVMQATQPVPNILEKRPDLPPALQVVIEKAMAKARDERYATAAAFVTAVKAVMNGEVAASATVVPTRTTPLIEIEPEPKVETKTAVTEPAAAPPPAAKSTPAQPVAAQPAAQSGGVSKWVYAVAGVVVTCIIGIIGIMALGGDDLPEETVVSERVDTEPLATVESVVEATAAVAVEPAAVDVSQAAQDTGTQFNYLSDPDQWDYNFPDGVDLVFDNGQAIFSTKNHPSYVWANHKKSFGDGTYEIEVTAISAVPGAVAFGMVFMYDEASLTWYEFTIDTNGTLAVFYCEARCGTVDEPLFGDWVFFDAIKTGVDVANIIRVEANQGTLTFFVNDQEFKSIFDDRRTSGDFGLIMYNDSEQEMSVMFDNFTYTPAP